MLQDSTTRIWDVRYLKSSVATLKAHMGAVRSLRFSPDGSVLAAAEPADFVDLFDVASNYESRQTVRFDALDMCWHLYLGRMLVDGPWMYGIIVGRWPHAAGSGRACSNAFRLIPCTN